jgi:hypothetical protein
VPVVEVALLTEAKLRIGIEVRNAGRAAVRRREVVRREAILSGIVVCMSFRVVDVPLVVEERDCLQTVASS